MEMGRREEKGGGERKRKVMESKGMTPYKKFVYSPAFHILCVVV